MFLGQCGNAIYASDRICAIATPNLLAKSHPFMAAILDGYASMRAHVLVRFGRWQALIAMPAPKAPSLRPIGVAMHAYGQGVAHAALGEIEAGEAAQAAFAAAHAAIPEEMVILNNPVREVLEVGAAMLAGELDYRRGNYDEAFRSLRLAVDLDDGLNYTEPWAWMHPPRHALGALLAEQGQFREAETVFRADLGFDQGLPRCCQYPNNVWALQGLMECVAQRGDSLESRYLEQSLELAQARADVAIDSA